MAKKHEKEINLWASMPEGTMVWCKRKNDKHWGLMKSPGWFKDNHYVIANDKAERKKSAIDAQL